MKKYKIIFFISVFFLSFNLIRGETLSSGDNAFTALLIKISDSVNNGNFNVDMILKTKNIKDKNEKRYLNSFLENLQNKDYQKINYLLFSGNGLNDGIVFFRDKENGIKTAVLIKKESLNKKLVKGLKFYKDFLKEEGIDRYFKVKGFSPTLIGGKLLNSDKKFIFIKNEENWKTPFVVFSYDDKDKLNSEIYIFYTLGKIISAAMGPFFVDNKFFIIKVKDRLKDKYLFLENMKIRLMGALFLKYLVGEEVLDKDVQKIIPEVFFKDISVNKRVFSFVKLYFGKKRGKKRDKKTFFVNAKKLLKSVLEIERKGDLETLKELIENP